ncbi:zinc ABC transporter substrate-binding protein [Candidatus Synechococcus calcipolaris G9]|uniref:Zinc ABC transporter substrate-binding protein n=1 Tax=Candidatus Synechococcus calcipolaris G9 TaxID=1497997 RepID=A0ABT6EYU6_9SYNE|nr:zinc ABC transporter substrate-binding protein [Candidatus Synechococcus calcipolaris]MDG2990185.1 zinc ABC transporter substrate-binding protein [Candidatus Synechococcus calcipolaris G9]
MDGKLNVVASYSVLCSMVEQIAATAIHLTCLINYDRDPHTYDATPADRRALERADVIFYGGMDFEPSIIQMVAATQSAAPKIPIHEQAVTDFLVDEVGNPDPHIWHNAAHGIEMVGLIQATLSQQDPENAPQYQANAEALIQELNQIHTWMPAQIATIPDEQRRLVTTHDAFGYYAQAYGLTIEGTLLGFSTEQEPTAAQVRTLIQAIRDTGVPTVFTELTTNDRVLQNVAKEAGVKVSDQVLIADGIGPARTPAGSYQGMLIQNTCVIAEGLGGNCTPF